MVRNKISLTSLSLFWHPLIAVTDWVTV